MRSMKRDRPGASTLCRTAKCNAQQLCCMAKVARHMPANLIALGHTIHCIRHGFKSGLPIGPFLLEMFILFIDIYKKPRCPTSYTTHVKIRSGS